jgi:transcription initiation factor IIE alpha subunit
MSYWNHINYFYNGNIPRKHKKAILGFKLSKNKIRKLLKTVKLGDEIKSIFEEREIKPFMFCPKCGCKGFAGAGNMAQYPEHWEKFNCIRCGTLVGYIDNSPFVHALECPDNNYDPSF